MMELSLVPFGHISAAVAATLPHLQVCERLSQGRSSVDDIVQFLITGRMQLWLVHDAERAYGIVVTEITQYPRCKLLTIQYCSMETGTLEVVDEVLHATMDRFAQDSGCSGVEYIGRAGWRPTAKKHGYTEAIVMYQKFFEVAQ